MAEFPRLTHERIPKDIAEEILEVILGVSGCISASTSEESLEKKYWKSFRKIFRIISRRTPEQMATRYHRGIPIGTPLKSQTDFLQY